VHSHPNLGFSPWAIYIEFKYLNFGYIEAVSMQPDAPPYANLAASLLPNRKTDGVVA
jgi:hypothetical protein